MRRALFGLIVVTGMIVCWTACSLAVDGEGPPLQAASGEPSGGNGGTGAFSPVGGSGGVGNMGGGGNAGGGGNTGGTGGVMCGDTPSPTDNNCPGFCDDCDNGTCVFNCDNNGCQGVTLPCASDRPCEVNCFGSNSCRDLSPSQQFIVDCPPTYECRITCSGNNACQGLEQQCDTGTCTLDCASGNSTCFGSALTCGDGQCNAICNTTNNPVVACGNACECTDCGAGGAGGMGGGNMGGAGGN